MTSEELETRIKQAKRLNKRERLEALQDLAQDIANHFQDSMSDLEQAIDEALDNTGEAIKNELGWHSVADVTQDISITPTWEH
jgi:chromosomal replication initiation ATPase DnaA